MLYPTERRIPKINFLTVHAATEKANTKKKTKSSNRFCNKN